MITWFKSRFSEASSWVAVGGLLSFIGIVFKDDNIDVVANAVTQNSESLANGDYVTSLINIGAATALTLGFITKENK